MANVSEMIKTNEVAIKRERMRGIRYDNIHAGAIVIERNRANTAEQLLEKHIDSLFDFIKLENVLLFLVLLVIIYIFIGRRTARTQRF
tara:strand:+ start:414 stop:677 length:264 start_codon:yes stop_codon:yes gene_type:complete